MFDTHTLLAGFMSEECLDTPGYSTLVAAVSDDGDNDAATTSY